MMQFIQSLLLFFYGTSPTAVSHHTPQARMVAYTLGGIIAFVTLPFVFAGTLFLTGTMLPADAFSGLRWIAVLAIASALTFAIVWVERALIILGDAVAPHWSAQAILLLVRLSMIALFSVVIASKWEQASHQGLITVERQLMRDEAIAHHKQYADQEFDVSGQASRKASAEKHINALEERLAMLPEDLVRAQAETQTCLVEAQRLWAEQAGLKHIENPNESQIARIAALKSLAPVKSAECRQLDRNIRQRIADYKRPLQIELKQEREVQADTNKSLRDADRKAKASYTERMEVAERALKEAGTDEKAFARVRAKNPEIDQAVKEKTALLAALELLPLLLKLLLWNSPISAEARAILQVYAAHYRDQMRQSISKEKAGYGFLSPHLPPPASPAMVSPYVKPPHVAPATEITRDGYWIGYPN